MPYTFKPGEKTKLFEDYTSRSLHPWTNLIIDSVEGDRANVHLDEKPETVMNVPVSDLQLPWGWSEKYTAVVHSVEIAKRMHSWLKERDGIIVWMSLDLSGAGRQMFSPAITSDGVEVTPDMPPHWSMGFVEKVADPDRIIIMIETELSGKPADRTGCVYSKSSKRWYKTEVFKP